jgi:TetR/AcrR family transcriptional regulator, regulator of cefoperazone and chloramphenicol sensitivity
VKATNKAARGATGRRMGSGYPCGEETRARLIDTAMALFGELGYEGASTRAIADNAGVNAPALKYYFKNKEGLYLACAQRVAALVGAALGEVICAAERAVANQESDTALIEAFVAIQAQLAEILFSTREVSQWLLIMSHEQAGGGPESGFRLMYEEVSKPLFDISCAIIGRLSGHSPSDDETVIRHLTLTGQITAFHIFRRTAMTALNWRTFGAKQFSLLKRINCEQTRAFLQLMANFRSAVPARSTMQKVKSGQRQK